MTAPDDAEGAAGHLFERATGRSPDGIEWLSSAMAGRTARITSSGERFFVKWSRTAAGSLALDAEADGLRRLNAVCPDHVLEVIGHASDEHRADALLVLEFIDIATRSSSGNTDVALANALTEIHAAEAGSYGLDRDNFIGATPQVNSQRSTWPAFFAYERLEAMADRLRLNNQWPGNWTPPYERLLRRLPDLLPEHPKASLLHGDLWSGNVMTSRDGRPVLIDPAVYHGHAETDLAMMQLFGGFSPRVFDAYANVTGLEKGFAERVEIYNLYHLFNHVLLFGAGYHAGVAKILDRF